VTLLVEDVAAARRFYRDVLGLDVVKDSKGYVELAGGGVRLALFSRRDLGELLDVPNEKVGPVDLSLSVEDMDGAFEELAARGAETLVAPKKMPWGKRAAFVRDEDGNLVELTEEPML
jgi:catechol 2,3-dioxygenase-like lactoylglutathione lyase family enzyme